MRPSASAASLSAFVAGLAGLVQPARAEPVLTDQSAVWLPVPVLFPVSPAAPGPNAPPVPDANVVRGPIEVSPDKAAVFWLDALHVARVRASEPTQAARLRFARVAGGRTPGAARAVIDEPGILADDGVFYLAQPPGSGNLWFVFGAATARVEIERVELTRGHVAWESIQQRVLAWIDSDTAGLELPLFAGVDELCARLDAERAIAQAIAAAYPDAPNVPRAARLWRQASAIQQLGAIRPLDKSFFRVAPLEDKLPGLAAEAEYLPIGTGRPYRRVSAAERTFTVEIDGPGSLRIDARALLTDERLHLPVAPLTVSVAVDARPLGRASTTPYPIRWQAKDSGSASQNTVGDGDDNDGLDAGGDGGDGSDGDLEASGVVGSSAVLPERVELTLPSGERVGPLQHLVVPLFPGRRAYTIRVSGGPVALRVTAGRRRPFAREAIAHVADEGQILERARRSLAGDDSPGAALIAHLLATVDERPTATPLPSELTAPIAIALVEMLRARAGIPREQLDSAVTRAIDALADAPWELGWYLRVVMASHLFARGQLDQERRLLAAAKSTPPPVFMATLAEIWPPLASEAERSRPVALMDLAWRAAPADPRLSARYRALFRERSDWARLSPVATEGRALVDDSRAWLRRDDSALGKDGAWGRMSQGRSVWVEAPSAVVDPSRAAIVRLAVSTPDGPSPVTVRIDGHAFTAVPVRPLERWSLALSAGEHEIAVDTAAGVDVYCSLTESRPGGYDGAAWVERAWPLEVGDRPVRYDLPAPQVQGPIRVRLRAVLSGRELTGGIRMVTDMGPSYRIQIEWQRPDAGARMIDAAGALSEPVSFVVTPPVGARHVWFESMNDMSIIASVSVRQPVFEPAAPFLGTAESGAAATPLGRIFQLSQAIDDTAPDVERLIQRAHLLLDLGFSDLAQRDAKRARTGTRDSANPSTKEALRALLARLDIIREPAHLPASSPAGDGKTPAGIAPADLALPGQPSAAVVSSVARARRGDSEHALTSLETADTVSDMRARYLHARLRADLGEYAEAGRELAHLSQDSESWQVAQEASIALGRALERGDTPLGLAALAYGVARDADAKGTMPLVRKVLIMASELSRWSPVRSADHTAGYQRVMVEVDADEMDPRTQVNDAMVAAPWLESASAQSVQPGRAAALQLSLLTPATLHADIWCRQTKLPRAGEAPECRVTVLVDGQPVANVADGLVYDDRVVATGHAIRFSSESLAPGDHRIEVKLANASRVYRASVRFASDRELPDSARALSTDAGPLFPLRVRRPATAFMAQAEAGRHIEITVNGPTALLITSRSIRALGNARPASTLDIDVREPSGKHRLKHLPLSQAHDPDAALREGWDRVYELTEPTTTVLPLPDAGAHHVTFAPDTSRVYVRVSLREDRRAQAAPPSEPWEFERPEDELIRWPGAPEELAELRAGWPPGSPGERGTFSIDTTVRRSELEDSDSIPLVTKLDITAEWRRRLDANEMWTYLALTGRRHVDGRYVLGARTRLQMNQLPGGLRALMQLRLYTQVIDHHLEWSADGRMDLQRPFRVHPDVTLVAELGLRTGESSLTFDAVPDPGPEIDADVYSVYGYFHRHAAIPRVLLRWQPFQDQIGSASAALIPNQDLASVDRIEGFFAWRTLMHVTRTRSVVTQVGYRPSYRFYDDDRFEGYGRHDLSASAEMNLWTSRTGRLRAHAQTTVYLSRLYGQSATFAVGLAYDITSGRGLRDFFSFEEEFTPYVEGRLFTHDDSP